MLVIGLDGMEPSRAEALMAAGRLPNLSKLAKRGGYVRLGTSIPPQSPVAWSDFITGADAGEHGVFDFIHRKLPDPTALYFSTSEIRPGATPWQLGSYLVPKPWSAPENVLLRHGVPFWDYLDARGIPVQMYRLPANFPPSPSRHDNVRAISGMGTPDLLASQGTYQYFSRDTDVPYGGEVKGGGRKMRIRFKGDVQTAELLGPPNPFVKDQPNTKLDIRIFPDVKHDVAKLQWTNESLAGDETRDVVLNVGEWSDWQPVAFKTVPWIQPGGTRAIVQFYLKQVHPRIRLYVSPINFDPRHPAMQISEPAEFAAEVASEMGPYATLGFAESFKALSHRVLSDDEYRVQAYAVLSEHERMLDYALRHYRGGLLFFYFSSSDLMAHMFWWQGQSKHPVRSPADAEKFDAVISEVYEKLDAALGRAVEAIGENATVLVLSDHGFNNWGRQVNLNNWLRDEGYLVPKDANAPWSGILENVDWTRSRAYAIGLNGIYLNVRGREKDGCVTPGAEREALLREISEKLLTLRDPESDRNVVKTVYRADAVYHGPRAAEGPDLIVGYDSGFRISGDSGIGLFEKAVVQDNRDAWSADHCIAAELVPGVLFSNRPILRATPSLIDLAPTILGEYAIPVPPQMRGGSVFKAAELARTN